MTPLADLALLETVMGHVLDAAETGRAEELLATASEAVASVTGRCYTLTPGEECTVTAYPQAGRVWLPRLPVLSVSSVTDADGSVLTGWTASGSVVTVPTACEVTITYRAGVDRVPDLEAGIVCQVVMRALSVPAESAGVQGETIDGYSYQLGASGASGGVGLLPAERAALSGARPTIAQPVSML